MKPIKNLIYLAVLCTLIVLAINTWRPGSTAAASEPQNASRQATSANACDPNRSVEVSGAAVINVTPDRVLLQLGVQTNGSTPDSVQSANSQEIQRVINAVRAQGVEAKDIATDYYIVYPVYEDFSSLVIKGYRIDNTVSITLRDVNLVDEVVRAALKAGANEIQDVQFYTSELRKYRDQAREMAIKAAGEKAQALAVAAGAQTGCVINVSENTWTQYYGSWRGGRSAAIWAQNVVQNASPSQSGSGPMDDTPMSLGQIAIRAEVSARYSLK